MRPILFAFLQQNHILPSPPMVMPIGMAPVDRKRKFPERGIGRIEAADFRGAAFAEPQRAVRSFHADIGLGFGRGDFVLADQRRLFAAGRARSRRRQGGHSSSPVYRDAIHFVSIFQGYRRRRPSSATAGQQRSINPINHKDVKPDKSDDLRGAEMNPISIFCPVTSAIVDTRYRDRLVDLLRTAPVQDCACAARNAATSTRCRCAKAIWRGRKPAPNSMAAGRPKIRDWKVCSPGCRGAEGP